MLSLLNAELQSLCPDSPQRNGVSKRFNQTMQKKIRCYTFDAELSENMWNLAISAAVYANNQKYQIKRFGCLAYLRVQCKTGPKFTAQRKRVILVGYTPSGYMFLRHEDRKFYESIEVIFSERVV